MTSVIASEHRHARDRRNPIGTGSSHDQANETERCGLEGVVSVFFPLAFLPQVGGEFAEPLVNEGRELLKSLFFPRQWAAAKKPSG